MNEKLIKDMLKCDGTLGNCEGCTFADNPECRNAMAHHAGALIQLQDVVIENQGKTIGGQKKKLAECEKIIEGIGQVNKDIMGLLEGLLDEMGKHRFCPACKHDGKPDSEEICEKCGVAEENHREWELDERFFPERKDGKEEKAEHEEVAEIE